MEKEKLKQKPMMRYIVPFCFSDEYEKVYSKMMSHRDWELENISGQGRHIYNHIYKTIHYAKEEQNEKRQGSAWKFQEKLQGGSQEKCTLELHLIKDNKTEDTVKAEISKVGVYLFQTGIGLFWYEIRFGENTSVELLTECEDFLKNLGSYRKRGWIKYNYVNREINIPRHQRAGEQTDKEIEKKWSILLIDSDDRTSGNSIPLINKTKNLQEKTFHLSPDYEEICKPTPFAGSKDVKRINFRLFELNVGDSGKYESAKIKYNEEGSFSIIDWICGTLEVLDCKLSFHMLHGSNKSNGEKPECALLYNYFVFGYDEGEEHDEGCWNQKLLDNAVRLSAGHNWRYLRAPDMKEQTYQPFKNAWWYVSNEGCGCYVYENKENIKYLSDNLSDEVRKDYFTLYILLLYQLYSLIHFSEKIEYELSANAKDYRKSSEDYNEKLKEIQTEINTFLLKSVHTCVSQTRAQNDFYNFAKKNLRIREEIQSLTAGVDFLEELLENQEQQRKEEEEERLSFVLGLLSFLGLLSAATDGVGFIDRVRQSHGLCELMAEGRGYSALIIVLIVILVIGVIYCVPYFMRRKNLQKFIKRILNLFKRG